MIKPRNEAELCDLLAAAARLDGWDVFPEVAGRDLLLVWNGTVRAPEPGGTLVGMEWVADSPVEPGYQLAVDAKMRATCDVLSQAAGRLDGDGRAPDATAVLVPEASPAFRDLARRLGLRVLTLHHCEPTTTCGREIRRLTIRPPGSPRTGRRLEVPPIPLSGSGGRPGPRTLSPWRVAALRLAARLEAGGVTRAEAKALGIARMTDWIDRGWAVSDGRKPATYRKGPRLDEGPVVGYRAEYEALALAPGARSSDATHANVAAPAPAGPAGGDRAPGSGS